MRQASAGCRIAADMAHTSDNRMRVLVADDDPQILRCYDRAFSQGATTGQQKALDELSAELFGSSGPGSMEAPVFELVSCIQGEQALSAARDAFTRENRFDVVILDIRMPPGLNGVEVAKVIRTLDPLVPIVFVSGWSDVSEDEIRREVPPPSRVHIYKKPLNFRKLAAEVTSMISATRNESEG